MAQRDLAITAKNQYLLQTITESLKNERNRYELAELIQSYDPPKTPDDLKKYKRGKYQNTNPSAALMYFLNHPQKTELAGEQRLASRLVDNILNDSTIVKSLDAKHLNLLLKGNSEIWRKKLFPSFWERIWLKMKGVDITKQFEGPDGAILILRYIQNEKPNNIPENLFVDTFFGRNYSKYLKPEQILVAVENSSLQFLELIINNDKIYNSLLNVKDYKLEKTQKNNESFDVLKINEITAVSKETLKYFKSWKKSGNPNSLNYEQIHHDIDKIIVTFRTQSFSPELKIKLEALNLLIPKLIAAYSHDQILMRDLINIFEIGIHNSKELSSTSENSDALKNLLDVGRKYRQHNGAGQNIEQGIFWDLFKRFAKTLQNLATPESSQITKELTGEVESSLVKSVKANQNILDLNPNRRPPSPKLSRTNSQENLEDNSSTSQRINKQERENRP